MPEPEAELWYSQPSPDGPIKTGDIFRGGALVAPGEPLLSLSPDLELRDPAGVAATYNGPIQSRPAPAQLAEPLGPVVEDAYFDLGYVILLSYTCDYSEPAKDHPLRLVSPLWNLYALPDKNGFRGLVWKHSERIATHYPLPALFDQFDSCYVNLRFMGLVQREMLPVTARVAALQQSAKHTLWQKVTYFLTRVRITTPQLEEIDSKYASAAERP